MSLRERVLIATLWLLVVAGLLALVVSIPLDPSYMP